MGGWDLLAVNMMCGLARLPAASATFSGKTQESDRTSDMSHNLNSLKDFLGHYHRDS